MELLKVKNLNVSFRMNNRKLSILEDVNLNLKQGDIIAVIGESGCGKSVLLTAIMKLLPPNAEIYGDIEYKGQNILNLSEKKLMKIRGKEIGFIMQNPSEALNPIINNYYQLIKPICLDTDNIDNKDKKAHDLIKKVGLEKTALHNSFPFQLSGGLAQRLLTGIGISRDPEFILADEPTKGLDSVLRNKIAVLLRDLVKDGNRTLLYVTHDLYLAKMLSHEVLVMYGGEIIEKANAKELFDNPLHPYTKGLISSLPSKGMVGIPGNTYSFFDVNDFCKFYNRCPIKTDACKAKKVSLKLLDNGRAVRCNYYD